MILSARGGLYSVGSIPTMDFTSPVGVSLENTPVLSVCQYGISGLLQLAC